MSREQRIIRKSGFSPSFSLLSSVFCLLLFTACCRTNSPLQTTGTITLSFRKVQCTAEVARTPEERSKGLMHRKSMPEDSGMLFIYPENRIPAFWMKNTLIPLSIAFIDPGGMIIDIQDMEPETEDHHSPPSRIGYALEMNKGWFEHNGIKVGDSVRGLPVR